MAKRTIVVEGLSITIEPISDNDYISITDIAKQSSEAKPAYTIQNWIRNNNTIRYLTVWEKVHNENVKVVQMHDLLELFTNNRTAVSAQRWIDEVNAIGLKQKKGRGGGTYAHRDIALNFMYWLSPEFQIYFIKEFQRLKEKEGLLLGKDWDVRREIAKANYPLVTQAVKQNLIPERLTKNRHGLVYASEADVINMAVFGKTAKQWKLENPEVEGNIRDHASVIDLLVLSNLQVLDASLIEWGSDQVQRIEILGSKAEEQRELLGKKALGRIEKLK